MEIEEENEAGISRNGVLNGSASQEEISCSPRRGKGKLVLQTICLPQRMQRR
jgi:hypothetical protein